MLAAILDENYSCRFHAHSRSICSYLASRYNKDDSLYPQDPKVRARIDALLYFDMGTLWPRFRNTIPRFGANENKANWLLFTSFVLLNGLSPERQPDAGELGPVPRALGWLDGFLGRGRFAAGTDHVTVADHVLVANVASFEAAGRLPGTRQKVGAWLERCRKEMPGYEEANGGGRGRWPSASGRAERRLHSCNACYYEHVGTAIQLPKYSNIIEKKYESLKGPGEEALSGIRKSKGAELILDQVMGSASRNDDVMNP
nr:uncharacterized protein LOC113822351 [Penaeus vannamei]